MESITVEEYKELLKKEKKGNKYGAELVSFDGYTFQSGAECNRYKQLVLFVRSGQITHFLVHEPRLIVIDAFTDRYGTRHKPTHYIPDFSYIEHGIQVIEDVKGGKATRTAVFEIKRKLILQRYPQLDFRIITM